MMMNGELVVLLSLHTQVQWEPGDWGSKMKTSLSPLISLCTLAVSLPAHQKGKLITITF